MERSNCEVRIPLFILVIAILMGTVAYSAQNNTEGSEGDTDRARESSHDSSQIADAGVTDGDAGDPEPPSHTERSGSQKAAAFEPPRIVQYIKAEYPEAARKAGLGVEVAAELDIDENGVVVGVAIKAPVGHGFDEAAEDAMYRFVFAPASRNGSPVASKVLYRYKFTLPEPAPPEGNRAQGTDVNQGEQSVDAPVSVAQSQAVSKKSDSPEEIPPPFEQEPAYESTVIGERRAEATAAAHYEVEVGKLRIVPRKNVTEQLMMAPGVLTTNHGGEGHAHETYMRGFASKEGQDIEFLVDGVPLNEIGNPHNHGYADLYFIPPEVVKSVAITEGAFDPEQGDFAFAGTAEYQLGVKERGSLVTYGLGMWNTHRTLALIAPPKQAEGTFAGFEYFTTDGYGVNRAAKRALGLGRYSGELENKPFKYNITLYGYAARYDQPGVVRQDDYEAGTMGFYDTYDPNQGGESNRLLTTLDFTVGPPHSNFEQVMFVGRRTMRLRTNFTGWMTDSTVDENGDLLEAQRGDGLEMRYKAVTGGARGRYAFSGKLFGKEQELSIGYALRLDQGESEQLRLRSVTAIPYLQVFDNDFTVWNIAGWLRAQLRPLDRLTLRGGVRLDTFSFGITDNNQPDADREGERVSNQTSQSFGFALNPRVTADVRLFKGLHALASYGQGTRSTDAAALSDNETAPFARAQEVDAGFAYHYGAEGAPLQLSLQTGYSLTKVNKDLIFSETEGRNVPAGASTRHAVLFSGRAQLFSLVDILANVGWTRATLDDTGELMPYIPRLVARLDAAVSSRLGDWALGSVPVTGRAGIGFTYVPGCPLPFKEYGDPMYLLSAGGELRLWQFSVGVEMRNLLNLEYRQTEFNYASNFVSPDAIASQLPERHFVAGEPFYIMGTLTWHIEEMIRSAKTPPHAGTNGGNTNAI